jgi:hypothetical protein
LNQKENQATPKYRREKNWKKPFQIQKSKRQSRPIEHVQEENCFVGTNHYGQAQ